ncbi:T9SS type A sorting domain-containing protein, partial [bacterium]|nr:T9SS type A sorting domain-containing protein [bacterium]
FFVIDNGTGVDNTTPKKINQFELSQNYPNPFNPETMIQLTVSEEAHVSVRIFNIVGQEVRRLVDADKPAGTYQFIWNGKDNTGRKVSSGVYMYQARQDTQIQMRRMIKLE